STFLYNVTPTPEIYTLSLHDALPISESAEMDPSGDQAIIYEGISGLDRIAKPGAYFSEGSISAPVDLDVFPWFFKWALGGVSTRSEEHTSELQSRENLVCRLLLEKKK